MGASKRMMLAKAMKEARAAKAGASSTPAADPVPPPTLSPPPPITAEAPFSSPPSSPHSPASLQTPSSPPAIAAVPLAAASSPAPTPLDKGKRVLEILSDDEDSEGVAPFKRRKSARVPLLVEASHRPRGVSNTKTVLSLIFSTRRPRLRRGLLQQRRIVPECLKRRVLWGGVVPSMVFPSQRYRGTPCQRFAGVWRSYLPPQSFLPVGIGEITPATNSASFSSPSTVFPTCGYRGGDPANFWVGDARDVSFRRRPLCHSRRRLGRLMLVSPRASSLT